MNVMVKEVSNPSLPKKRWLNRTRKDTLTFYILISPWIIGFLTFVFGPMLASLYFSFTKWDMLTTPKWYGIGNYLHAFKTDPLFYQALKVTMTYAVFGVPLQLVCSLLLAMLLHQAVAGMRLFRTIFYLPAVVSGVSVMVLWMYIFNPQIGLLNTVLKLFGLPGKEWIFDPNWALPSLIMMSLWGIGGGMIIWLAGLNGIPSYLYESAEIDGANVLQRFRYVTVPMLTPTIFFNLIMGIVGAMQAFSEAYVMTNGGPLYSTLFYNFLLYQRAFTNYEMGYASALAWILFFIIFILTLIVIRSSSAWVYYEGERK